MGHLTNLEDPHPKSLSQNGRGTLNLAPLLPSWEKGLGDEGARWGDQPGSRFNLNNLEDPHPKSLSQNGRGTLNLAPLLPSWEKGLGDEGLRARIFGVRICINSSALMDLSVLFDTSAPLSNPGRSWEEPNRGLIKTQINPCGS